jgi:chromate transport protein ChrA
MINFVVYFLPTLLAAWLGWRWKRWRGVFIAVVGLWLVLIILGILFLSLSEQTIKNILQNYPPAS